MPSEDECHKFNQQIEELKESNEKRDKHFHNHIRELRRDFSDNVAEQISRHNELTLAQQENTKAINDLVKSTQSLVDAITAGKVIGGIVRWAAPLVVAIAGLVAWYKS